MFYYYGRKKRLAKKYPVPNTDTIIEPFAGSAAYSLFEDNWKKRVILVEKDAEIAALWRWFIQEATEQDILDLPDPVVGEHTTLRLHILHGVSNAGWSCKKYKATPLLVRNWETSKKLMLQNLPKIKHWEIIEGDYSSAPDIEATWFIDPPYQGKPGAGYKHGSAEIDFESLAQWVRSRKGEVIVCEQSSATWLPFEPLTPHRAASGQIKQEGIYYRTNPREQE
jgi:site-specific DNA-adenine methylase